MRITNGQMRSLIILKWRHDRYPMYEAFASVHLGKSTAALLRKLADGGLVHATRGGRGSRQFFSITDAGLVVVDAKDETK